jgi:hypothetical protein
MDLSQLELPRLDLAPFDPAALGATQPEATLPEATLPEATAEPAPRPTFRVLSPEELHPGDYYAPVVRADKIHPPDKPERPSAPRGDYVNRLRTRRTTPHNP